MLEKQPDKLFIIQYLRTNFVKILEFCTYVNILQVYSELHLFLAIFTRWTAQLLDMNSHQQ